MQSPPRLPLIFVRGAPFLKVLVGFQEYLGLIDTGADHAYLDPSIIDRHYLATIRMSEVSSASHNYMARVVNIEFSLVQARRTFRLEAYESPLRATGREYSLILGRSFLRAGILHLDYCGGEHWFEFGPAN